MGSRIQQRQHTSKHSPATMGTAGPGMAHHHQIQRSPMALQRSSRKQHPIHPAPNPLGHQPMAKRSSTTTTYTPQPIIPSKPPHHQIPLQISPLLKHSKTPLALPSTRQHPVHHLAPASRTSSENYPRTSMPNRSLAPNSPRRWNSIWPRHFSTFVSRHFREAVCCVQV
jgi:hypothetical protein